MRIALLLLDGVSDTGYTAALDALLMANQLRDQLRSPVSAWSVSVVGPSKGITTQRGARVSTQPMRGFERPDVVFVPAPGIQCVSDIGAHIEKLSGRALTPVLRQLRLWGEAGVLVTTACAGTFTLAAAGLLERRHATTAWWLAATLREAYPTVRVVESRMLLRDGNVVTAGAFLGHLDVALWLIRQHSVQLADLTARYLVATPGVSQAPYIIPQHIQHTDPMIALFEQLTRDNLSEPLPMRAIAKKCGISERTLHRRITATFSRSPLAQIQQWRMETALHLLSASGLSIDEVAAQVGYSSATVLRTLVRRRHGVGLRADHGS